MTISGPLQHLWMFGAAFLLMKINVLSLETYEQFMFQCTVILLFNLLPIWPLDGGKLLFNVQSFFTILEAHKLALRLSTFFSYRYYLRRHYASFSAALMDCYFIFNYIRIFGMEEQAICLHALFVGEVSWKRASNWSFKTLSVSTSETLHQVLQKFQRGCKHMIIATSQTGEHVQIDENELLHAYFVEKEQIAH